MENSLLQVLQSRLTDALTTLPDDEDVDKNAARVVVRHALMAVNDYLRDIGLDVALRAPLIRLSAALEDVGEGRRSELLKPAAYRPTAARITISRQALWSTCCAALDELDKVNRPIRPDLMRDLCRALSATESSLRGFGVELSKRRGPVAAVELYEETRKAIEASSEPDGAAHMAMWLIERVMALSKKPAS